MASIIIKAANFIKNNASRKNIIQGVGILGGIVSFLKIINSIRRILTKRYWKKIASEVREQREKKDDGSYEL